MLTILPIWAVDVGGAVMMIVLSFLSVRYAILLRARDPQNIVWSYLFWMSMALALFAVSRSLGHIAKQILIITGNAQSWERLRPYSGAINSIAFTVVGGLTLFFERTWTIYQGMVRDRRALQHAHQELLYLNQNLESLVQERTAALANSEQRYWRIFQASRDMILSTDPQGSILDLNPAGLKMLGLVAGELTEHCRFPQFLSNPAQWHAILDQILQQGFVASTELDLKVADGKLRRVLLSGTQEVGGDGNIHFVVKDIEQQHVMREQMAQTDKLASIGELSAGLAHEINNPLGIILGYTQLMLRQEHDDSQRRDDLKTVERHVRHCKSIVEDLLNFARTSKPKKELLDIHVIVDDVLHFIQQHSHVDGIRIETLYDQRIGALLLDEKKIKQVLINLLMNAKYAMEGGGMITIHTGLSACGRRVLIGIQDTGSGIEKKDLARIFDPFFTTKPTGEGTGLGLSVSYGIIKNHGGDITVESRVGQGTTFTIVLPVPASTVEN
jgi:two-component system, NtrC family, sensor kinase